MSTTLPFGAFRRRIRLVATADEVVEGGPRGRLPLLQGRAAPRRRARWSRWTPRRSAGRGARARTPGTPLHALEGMPLSDRCLAVGDWAPPRLNCTHMFDLAGLAVAHAARHVAGGAERRQYDVEIPFGAQFGRRARRAGLARRRAAPHVDARRAQVRRRRRRSRTSVARRVPALGRRDVPARRVRADRSCCAAPATSAWAAAWTSTASTAPPSSASSSDGICYTMQPEQSCRSRCATSGSARDWDGHPDDLLSQGPH